MLSVFAKTVVIGAVLQTIVLDDGPAVTRGRCSGGRTPDVLAQADNNGTYVALLHGAVRPVRVCLFVDATGGRAGQTVTGSTEADSLFIGFAPLDSTRIDVVVR